MTTGAVNCIPSDISGMRAATSTPGAYANIHVVGSSLHGDEMRCIGKADTASLIGSNQLLGR
jgi:hypothetical protein